jgi:hypothetical protein
MFRNKPQKELGFLPWYKCSFLLFCKLMPEVKTQNTKAKFASSIKEDFQLNDSERLEGELLNPAQKSETSKMNSLKFFLHHPSMKISI